MKCFAILLLMVVFLCSCASAENISGQNLPSVSPPDELKVRVLERDGNHKGKGLKNYIENILRERGFSLSVSGPADILVVLDEIDGEPGSSDIPGEYSLKRRTVAVRTFWVAGEKGNLSEKILSAQSEIIESIRAELASAEKELKILSEWTGTYSYYVDFYHGFD